MGGMRIWQITYVPYEMAWDRAMETPAMETTTDRYLFHRTALKASRRLLAHDNIHSVAVRRAWLILR